MNAQSMRLHPWPYNLLRHISECIAMTGIAKIRGALEEKEDSKGMKSLARSNMSGKTGKMDIDYQVLYNAFFKYQTKPENMTIHGDMCVHSTFTTHPT